MTVPTHEEILAMKVGRNEKLALHVIATLGHIPTGQVWADACGVSLRTMRSTIKSLCDAGVIKAEDLPEDDGAKSAPLQNLHPGDGAKSAPLDDAIDDGGCKICTPEPKTAEIRHFLPALVVSEKPQNSAILGEGRGGIIGGGGEGATSYHTDFNPPYLPIEGRKGGVGGKQNSGFELEPTAAPASRTPRTGSKRTFAEFLRDSGDGKRLLFDELARMFKNRGWELPNVEAIYAKFSHWWLEEKTREKKSNWPRAFFNWAELDRDKWAFLTEEQRNARRRAGGRQNTVDDIAEQKRKALHEYAMFKARETPDGIFGRRLAETVADGADVGASETERARITYDPGSF